jgi:hypothetical protein
MNISELQSGHFVNVRRHAQRGWPGEGHAMVGQNSEQRSQFNKSRGRELAIVVAAFLVACVIGLAVRNGFIDTTPADRPDVVAK